MLNCCGSASTFSINFAPSAYVVLRPSMTNGMDAYMKDLEKHVVTDCWHRTPEEKPREPNRLALAWSKRRSPSE